MIQIDLSRPINDLWDQAVGVLADWTAEHFEVTVDLHDPDLERITKTLIERNSKMGASWSDTLDQLPRELLTGQDVCVLKLRVGECDAYAVLEWYPEISKLRVVLGIWPEEAGDLDHQGRGRQVPECFSELINTCLAIAQSSEVFKAWMGLEGDRVG